MNLSVLYTHRFSQPEQQVRERLWKQMYDSFLSRCIARTDTVCDIGAGSCEFLRTIRAKKKIAVDIQYKKALFSDGIWYYRSVESVLLKEKHKIDVVMLSNILEHLKDREEIIALLHSTGQLLAPGGSLLIIQPTIDLVHERYWDFFDHIVPITRTSLLEALSLAGFEVQEFVPRFLPYTTKSRIPLHPLLLRLYLLIPWRVRPFAGQCFVRAICTHIS